jgi:hypothetical protein
MTDDLVKRLRIIGAWKTPGGPLPSEEMIKPHLTCEEAADRIEQLEAALRLIANTDPAGDQHWAGRIARTALGENNP